MRVDVDSLGTYNRLAREGAERAADSMGRLTGVETHVEVTSVNLLSGADLRTALSTGTFAGVRIRFDGGLAGQTVLAFEPGSVDRLTGTVLPRLLGEDATDAGRSGIEEVGNIVTSGFVDGWADYLGTAIDISTPEFVDGDDAADLLAEVPVAEDEYAFVFEAHLDTADEAVGFRLFMLPERESVRTVVGADGADDALPVDRLVAFDRMTSRGAESASDHMTAMTGMETDVEVTQLSFVPVHEAPRRLDDRRRLGAVLELEGLAGYLAILFDADSAETVADALVPGGTGADDGLGSMGRSALAEVCNVMTSGFIDGWADVLAITIDHSPPDIVDDMGSAVLDPVAARLGRTQEHAFVVDTVIRTDGREVGCDVYVLPEADALTDALGTLDPDRLGRLDSRASFERIEGEGGE
jgi:chemotaxis protein CheY-P-specific phosphatase CheC